MIKYPNLPMRSGEVVTEALQANPETRSACLVGIGFRLWLKGCQTAKADYWEKAWDLYRQTLGEKAAVTALDELAGWVNQVVKWSTREIEVSPVACSDFCRDECLALAMIAACQHNTCPAMRACAFALVENSNIQNVVDQSEQFALTLRAVDQVLPPNYIVCGSALDVTPQSAYVQ